MSSKKGKYGITLIEFTFMSTTTTLQIDRTMFDSADSHTAKYVAKPGINEEVVRLISSTKNEPEWMLQKRLKALELFGQTAVPTWGPDLAALDFNSIVYFVDPNATEQTTGRKCLRKLKIRLIA